MNPIRSRMWSHSVLAAFLLCVTTAELSAQAAGDPVQPPAKEVQGKTNDPLVQDPALPPQGNPAFSRPGLDEKQLQIVTDAMMKSLSDSDKKTREIAASTLALLGQPALDDLLKATKSKDKALRANAFYALGKMAKRNRLMPMPVHSKKILDAAIAALRDEESEVRRHAAYCVHAALQSMQMQGDLGQPFPVAPFGGIDDPPGLPPGAAPPPGLGGQVIPPAIPDPGVLPPKKRQER